MLVWGGLATLAFGAVGMLASQQLGRLAGFSIIVSSGTLLAAIGFGQPALTGGALFYLVSSTLAACALFLLVELIERSAPDARSRRRSTTATTTLPLPRPRTCSRDGTNLDDDRRR